MMLIFHIFSYFRFKKKYCIINVTFYNKNEECYLQFLKINVCDLRWEQIIYNLLLNIYLTQRKECYLDIDYILLILKGNNNRGKEVNFKGRKANVMPSKE